MMPRFSSFSLMLRERGYMLPLSSMYVYNIENLVEDSVMAAIWVILDHSVVIPKKSGQQISGLEPGTLGSHA